MFISDTLAFVRKYIDEIDGALKVYDENAKLANSQKAWLEFCVMAVFATRTFCWAKFERACLGTRSSAALSWMFRWSAIPWQILLAASTVVVIRRFGITRGRLLLNETDKKPELSRRRRNCVEPSGTIQAEPSLRKDRLHSRRRIFRNVEVCRQGIRIIRRSSDNKPDQNNRGFL